MDIHVLVSGKSIPVNKKTFDDDEPSIPSRG
jgi:hypothetical protein